MCATMSRRERLIETFAWDCYATWSTTPHAPSCYRSTSRSRSGSTDSDGVGQHLACCVFAAFGKPILAMWLQRKRQKNINASRRIAFLGRPNLRLGEHALGVASVFCKPILPCNIVTKKTSPELLTYATTNRCGKAHNGQRALMPMYRPIYPSQTKILEG